jgi:zinc protease
VILTPRAFARTTLAGLALVAVVHLEAAPAVAAPPPAGPLDGFLASVKKTTLPNGLTLLVREQPGTGVVAINTWVKAGYFNEPDEVAGMAHLFEHMFFKGSKKFPGAEQISQELAAVGGDTNAGTIYDSTNYFFVVPTEGFGRALEIMADAIANPLFDAGELERESEVVIEESNRKLDNPPALSLERMIATSFTQHRIKRWRIGSNEVLRNIERENLLQFFRTLYLPQNMILSIAGDVRAADVEKAVAATFGTLATAGFDKRRGPAEPAQTEFRYGSSTGDLKQGYSVFGWHTQGVGGDAELALDLASQILGSGRSSRFFRHVVGPDAAATANAFHYQFDDVGLMIAQASFDEARRAEVDRRLLAEIERLKLHGPTAYELALAKNSLRAQVVFALEDAVGQAQALAEAEARDSYLSLGARLAKLDRVTADEVRAAAKRFLSNDRLTLYHYAPNGTPALDRAAAFAQVQAAVATPPAAEPGNALPAAFSAVASAKVDRRATEVRLSNGARLVVRERPGAPSVAVGLYLDGGRSAESSANAGITQLAVSSLRRGAGARSGEEIDRSFEFLGTALSSDVTPDFLGVEMEVVAANLRPALELFADVVLHPTFPAEGIAEERALQLASVRRAFDSSTQRPQALALADLWPTHPYGLPAAGTEDSVAALGAADLAAWWKGHLAAEDATLVVVGDVAADAAQELVEKAFAGLPRRGSARPALRAPGPPADAHREGRIPRPQTVGDRHGFRRATGRRPGSGAARAPTERDFGPRRDALRRAAGSAFARLHRLRRLSSLPRGRPRARLSRHRGVERERGQGGAARGAAQARDRRVRRRPARDGEVVVRRIDQDRPSDQRPAARRADARRALWHRSRQHREAPRGGAVDHPRGVARDRREVVRRGTLRHRRDAGQGDGTGPGLPQGPLGRGRRRLGIPPPRGVGRRRPIRVLLPRGAS